jgi:hypothetical protein
MKELFYKWNLKLSKFTAGLSIFAGVLTFLFAPIGFMAGALPSLHSLMVILVVALFFLIMGQCTFLNIKIVESLKNKEE